MPACWCPQLGDLACHSGQWLAPNGLIEVTHLVVILIGLLNLCDRRTTTKSYTTTVISTPNVFAKEMEEATGQHKQQAWITL